MISVFYGKWNSYDGNKLLDIPFINIDRLYYGYFKPNANDIFTEFIDIEKENYEWKENYLKDPYIINEKNIKGNFYEIKKIKQKFQSIKVIMSIGGWENSEYFLELIESKHNIDEFLKDFGLILKDFSPIFDGIDIDFEKITKENSENFRYFIECLYKLINPLNYILTIQLPSSIKHLSRMNLKLFDHFINSYNLMTYDFSGPEFGNLTTGHHANIYPNIKDPNDIRKNMSGISIIDYLTIIGINKSKINLGVAFHGKGFKYEENGQEPFLISKGKVNEENLFSYRDIELNFEKKFWKWDDLAKAAYIKDEVQNIFISFDEEKSIFEKKKIVKQRGLQGLFGFEIGDDTQDFKLLKYMKDL